jgi:hypothetical protein
MAVFCQNGTLQAEKAVDEVFSGPKGRPGDEVRLDTPPMKRQDHRLLFEVAQIMSRQKHPPGPPMTLSNMRGLGVRGFDDPAEHFLGKRPCLCRTSYDF